MNSKIGLLNINNKKGVYYSGKLTWEDFCRFCDDIEARFYDAKGKRVYPRDYKNVK